MNCRSNCGACCIAPSINHPLPNMPNGKPAGIPCVNLDPETLACAIWGSDEYPNTCKNFIASEENCGKSRVQAIEILSDLEELTAPKQ